MASEDRNPGSQQLSLSESDVTSREVLAAALMRELASPRVLIEDPYVYVEDPGEGVVVQYEMPDHSLLLLEALDRGEPLTLPVNFELVAPRREVE
jgi:hypothetical protein